MSFSPLLWKSFDISEKQHQQLFLGQLTDLLNFLNSAQGMATLLNGNSLLGATALSVSAKNLGNVTTNQTVDSSQAASIAGFIGVNTNFSPTVTFINLTAGTPFSFRFSNTFSGAVTFKIAATNVAGSSYTVMAFTSSAATNMTSTGLSVAAGQSAMFSGAGYGLALDLLANVT